MFDFFPRAAVFNSHWLDRHNACSAGNCCDFTSGRLLRTSVLQNSVLLRWSLQACINSVVDGLFSAVATLGVVPIIKCPKVRACTYASLGL